MKKILLVDDASFARKLIRSLIDKNSYEILEAGNGKEALEKILQDNPDLVLLDLNMPEMGGLDVLTALKEKGIKTKIVILTADIQSSTRERCLKLGACDVINKPPKDNVLMNKIKELI